MSVIDERVARIKLDNQQFESAAKTSSNTLQRLKKNMDFAAESSKIDGVQNSLNRINFGNLNRAIELTKSKFSLLGTIGDQVTRTITNGFTNTIIGGMMKLGSQLKNGGMQRALNIEQAKFMFQGLGMDVKKSMESANEAVKGTAYGLDEAASAASQFGASGMKAGSQMTSALRGIAGVAAMTGASYRDISDIFTTISGNGRLMSEQLLQLSARGVNAASTLAKYLHKSESEVRDMVSKGKIDFNTFAKAMDDAFGSHAKDANKTFTGSLSNMKAAINRIGADIAIPYLENARNIYNALTPVIDAVHKSLKPLLDAISTFMTHGANHMIDFINRLSGPLNDTAKYVGDLAGAFIKLGGETRGISIIKAFGQVVQSYLYPVLKGAMGIIPQLKAADLARNIINTLESISNAIKQFSLSTENSKKLTYIVNELATAFKSLLSAIAPIFGALPNFGSLLNAVIGKVLDLMIKVIDITKKVVDVIRPIFESGSERLIAFSNGIKSVHANFNGLSRIADVLHKAMEAVKVVFSGTADALSTFSSKSKEALSAVADTTGSFIKDLLEQVPKIAKSLIEAVNSILKEVAGNLDWDAAFEIVRKGFSTYFFASFVHSITTVIKRVTGDSGVFGALFYPIRKAVSNFGTVFGQITDVLRSKTRDLNANAIMKIAAAIGVLAASFKVLSTISWEGLSKGIAGVASSFGMLILTFAALNKLMGNVSTVKASVDKLKDSSQKGHKSILDIVGAIKQLKALSFKTMQMNAMADSLVKIAGSVLILAYAVEKFSKIKTKDLAKGIMAMAVSMGLLIAAFASLNALNKRFEGMSSLSQMVHSGTLIGYAAAFYLLGKALEQFNKIDWSSIGKGVVAAGSAILAFVALSAAMNLKIGRSKIGAGSVKNMLAFAEFSGSLYLIGKAMEKFKTISWDGIAKSVLSIASVMTAFALVMRSMAKSSKYLSKGSSFLKMGTTMVLMSLSLVEIAKAMSNIAKIDTSGIAKSLLSIVTVMTTFALVLKAMSKINTKDAKRNALSILELSVSLVLIAKSLTDISKIQLGDIAKSLTAIFAAFKIMAMAAREVKGANFGSLVSEAGSIVLIAISLKTLSTIDVQGMAVAVGGLSSTLLAIAGISKVMAKSTKDINAMAKNSAKASAALILLDIAIGGMAATFKLLSTIPIKGALSAASSLTAILAILYAAIKFIGTMKIDMKTVAKVALMALVVGGIGTVIALLSASGADDALKAAAGMSSIIVAVSVALKMLSAVNVSGAAKAVGTIAVLVGGLGVIVAAMGGIAQIPGAKWLMSEGKKFMQSIGEAFGALIGGFTGGVAATAMALVSRELPELGSGLSSFAKNVKPFVELGNSKAIFRLPAMVASIATAIVALSGAGIANHIANIMTFGDAIPKLGKALEGMTPAIKSMNKLAVSIDISKVKSLADTFKALGEFATMVPKTGGLFQNFTGRLDLSKFAKDIVNLSSNMVKIESNLKKGKFDPEPINQLAKAAMGLAKVQRALTPLNGLQNKIMGSKDLRVFGSSVEALAESMTKITGTMSRAPFDVKLFDKLATAAMGLAKVEKALPDTGGLKQKILGSKDLSSLAVGLADIGKAFGDISGKIAKIDFSKLGDFTKSLNEFAKIINVLPDANGLKQALMGWKSYKTISNGLSGLGTALNDFYLAIWAEPADAPSKIREFAKSAKALSGLMPNIPDAHGLKQLFVGSKSWSTISNGLADFGKAMSNFSKNISGVDIDVKAVGKIVDASKKLVGLETILPTVGLLERMFTKKQDFKGFSEQISSFGKGINSYSHSVNGIDAKAIQRSATAASALVGLEKSMPSVARISTIFKKTMSFSEFGADLRSLGNGMKMYGSSIKGIDVGAINRSVLGVRGLANVAKELSAGSIFSLFRGKNNGLSNLAPQLSGLGYAMKIYGKQVSGVNIAAINKSVIGVQGLANVAKALSAGNAFAFFTGKNNGLNNLAPQLMGIGQAIKGYSKVIGNAKFGNIQGSVSAVRALGSIAKELSAGAFSKFFGGGNNGLSQLSYQLPLVGKALASYAGSVKGKDFGSVLYSCSAMTSLASTMQRISKGNNYNISGFANAVNALRGVKVIGLGKGFSGASKTVSSGVNGLVNAMNSGSKSIDNAANRLKKSLSLPGNYSSNVGPMMGKISAAIGRAAPSISRSFDAIVNTMRRFGTNSTNAVNRAGDRLVNAVSRIANDVGRQERSFNNAGKSLATSLRRGMDSVNLGNKMVSQVRQAASDLSRQSGAFNSAGQNVGQGFVNGINAMQRAAYQAGVNLGNQALAGAKSTKALDIHSPSKATYRMGVFTAQGLINGMASRYEEVTKAGSKLGRKVKDSVLDSVFEINESLDDAMLRPVITPVINMDSIKEQAKTLGSILNKNSRLDITGSEFLRSNGLRHDSHSERVINNNYNFTQNNNSPKALNAAEIYRNTRNQLAVLRNG